VHNTARVAGHGPVLELGLGAVAALSNALLLARIRSGPARTALWLLLSVFTTLSVSTAAAENTGIFVWLPGVDWFRAAGLFWVMVLPFMVIVERLRRPALATRPARRTFLKCVAAASVAAPASAAICGFAITKRDARVRELVLPFPNLPRDLHNLRIAQITDIHLSAFYSRRQLARAVDQANELRPHVSLVTGDLITSYGDPLDDAILELSRLSADAGVYGCLGNHEILAEAEDYTTARGARFGLRFLRQDRTSLSFGSAHLNLAGVDYQRMGSRYLVDSGKLLRQDEFNLLLSHNPDVFPVAARQGWDLTLSGHTHGGQIALEYLSPHVNPARCFTRFTDGVYKAQNQTLFVSSGLGTVGLPIRLGTEPEIALIRLVRA